MQLPPYTSVICWQHSFTKQTVTSSCEKLGSEKVFLVFIF
ncbi:hypothetical Protein YC6258_00875 [Gynuella sunshinyii YC6258]|uniref:Uncharacterized protein n=1 Tax=Gynuella sunshinyii YC6258 TaxID=1445510 RepID=A0A0C5V028_9GAMM|nr:hypothetical Protein YC6258_00875 [Gynuella sunshinyii YC6258]